MQLNIRPVKQIFLGKNCDYIPTHQYKHVFWGVQKNRLIQRVLLSTHTICFGWEIRKIILCHNFMLKNFVCMPGFLVVRLILFEFFHHELGAKLGIKRWKDHPIFVCRIHLLRVRKFSWDPENLHYCEYLNHLHVSLMKFLSLINWTSPFPF